jgi:Lrp/AsnC family transcriptional regulator, leucine-responsive regulatory protein
MKNIRPRLVSLLQTGYCTPHLVSLARKLKEPTTTIHYNLKKMEKDGTIKAFKAVFDYSKIDKGFLAIALVSLTAKADDNPEIIGRRLAGMAEIESVDVCTGDWEFVLRIRVKDQNEYYQFTRHIVQIEGVSKIHTLTSLRQLKTEFIELP